MKIYDLKGYGTTRTEFKHFVGRLPKKGEMETWCHLLENGMDAQLDWKIICECAAEEVKRK